jgi:hypothetical protein
MAAEGATQGQYLDPETNLYSLVDFLRQKGFEVKQNLVYAIE